MGKGSDPVTGYKYSFGIHMGISRGPINELVEIKVGDKTAWAGSRVSSGEFVINSPQLFGGDKQEGGIAGVFNLQLGEATQTAPASLVSMLGHALPGFRRMVTAFYNGQIASNSPYPKAWKFRIRRSTAGWQNNDPWYPAKALISLVGPLTTQTIKGYGSPPMGEGGLGGAIDDVLAQWYQPDVTTTSTPPIHAMNPAHIIYECITNQEWGRGLPASSLNIASFVAAADALYAEGFGLCLRWTRRDSLQSFVQSVIDHIGAVIYSDRETALLTIKLIRNDYNVATLPLYDTDSGILEIRENEVSALGPAINEVVVEYTDPITGDKRTANAQNLASLQASRGVFNSLKKTYSGIPTSDLALRVAQRDLRANATALRRFTMTFDRRAWKIAPASVFRIQDTVRNIPPMVVRVGRIDDGTLTNGKITITAVQDVFSLPATSFQKHQHAGTSSKPDTAPRLRRHRAFEAPYFLVRASMTAAEFDYLEPDVGFLGTVVEKPSDLSLAYNLFVKSSAPTPDETP